MAKRLVLQFKITLQEIKPSIWRRIQISDLASFWDLHVAIQDAMGWLDCHLHHFEVNHSITHGKQYMGIPAYDDFDILNTLPSWEYKVRDYLVINQKMVYAYDYGDGWQHLVEYEGLHNKEPNSTYPTCLAGERACPPEDVGGVWGYDRFLAAIKNPSHPEHKRLLEWVGELFNAEHFVPGEVTFDNPRKRWKRAFVEDGV